MRVLGLILAMLPFVALTWWFLATTEWLVVLAAYGIAVAVMVMIWAGISLMERGKWP